MTDRQRMDDAIKALVVKLNDIFEEITDAFGYEVRFLYSFSFIDRINSIADGYTSIGNLDIKTFEAMQHELETIYNECKDEEQERECKIKSIKEYYLLSLDKNNDE